MGTEPKTIRESNFFVAGIDARLGLVQKMVWAVLALIGTLLAGAAALYFQIGDLKIDLAVVKANLAVINDRVAKIDKSVEGIGADQARMRETLTRIEARLAARNNIPSALPLASVPIDSLPTRASSALDSFPDGNLFTEAGQSSRPLSLTDSETRLIRDALKERVLAAKTLPERAASPIEPLPETVSSKIPRLGGLRYFISADGTINIVGMSDRHVLGTIVPD